MSKLLKLIVITLLLSPAPALAVDLQQVKNNGLVGEQLNGYLGWSRRTPPLKCGHWWTM